MTTVIADASWDEGKAGLGYWAASPERNGEFGGACCSADGSQEAELWATLYGLHFSIQGGWLRQGDPLHLYGDNANMLQLILASCPRAEILQTSEKIRLYRPTGKAAAPRLVTEIVELMDMFASTVIVSYARARSTHGAAQTIMRQCDLRSKAERGGRSWKPTPEPRVKSSKKGPSGRKPLGIIDGSKVPPASYFEKYAGLKPLPTIEHDAIELARRRYYKKD